MSDVNLEPETIGLKHKVSLNDLSQHVTNHPVILEAISKAVINYLQVNNATLVEDSEAFFKLYSALEIKIGIRYE